ncbi:hypothetical protein [Bacteroides uniformis]|uniref:hypothetical protein n=1 Tax=Bacteroides uniformis TaxID=820 RepID=UPI00189C39A1|nr:hypothetical protein [Bacteroides uniformis]MDC1998320.1 hypothetical protein [Bacteroides uniformis]MDC2002018.1 hypothetical protein [Bacteroides uniformis]MDC2005936.1 hypothetical protein [Bacteroides uniformis]
MGDIPPSPVGRAVSGKGVYLADAEIRQAFLTDGHEPPAQLIETHPELPVCPPACGKREVRPQRGTDQPRKEPPASVSPFFSLHRV